jgi:hypothetical protein
VVISAPAQNLIEKPAIVLPRAPPAETKAFVLGSALSRFEGRCLNYPRPVVGTQLDGPIRHAALSDLNQAITGFDGDGDAQTPTTLPPTSESPLPMYDRCLAFLSRTVSASRGDAEGARGNR